MISHSVPARSSLDGRLSATAAHRTAATAKGAPKITPRIVVQVHSVPMVSCLPAACAKAASPKMNIREITDASPFLPILPFSPFFLIALLYAFDKAYGMSVVILSRKYPNVFLVHFLFNLIYDKYFMSIP